MSASIRKPSRERVSLSVRHPHDAAVLSEFIEVFCRGQHRTEEGLCASCRELQNYALGRLDRCPYDPKPACRRCPTHCYGAEQRTRIRQVMRYSGLYFVRRGRLDWLLKYFVFSKIINRDRPEPRRKNPPRPKLSSIEQFG